MIISKVLISQPKPSSEKSPYSELISKNSVELDFRPFISVRGVTLKEFIAQRVKILDHTAVVFTSRTLIDNFFRIVGENRVVIPDSMKYFCISESIALYLQKYIVYRKRKIFFADNSVTSLVEIILKHGGERYLVPLSNPHKPELPLAFERASLTHSTVILSHAECSDLSDVEPTSYDIVALYSPSEVKNFDSSFVGRGFCGRVAVFGEATARAVLAAGIGVDIMAPQPGLPSMIMALDAYMQASSKGADLSSFGVNEIAPEDHAELLKLAERRRVRTRKSATDKTATKGKAASKTAGKTAAKAASKAPAKSASRSSAAATKK